MSNAYRAVVSAGGGAAVGDATAADVLTGKTFSGAVGSGVSGTMPNQGAVSGTATPTQPYTIPAGYHNGSGTVTASGTAASHADATYCGDTATGTVTATHDGVIIFIGNVYTVSCNGQTETATSIRVLDSSPYNRWFSYMPVSFGDVVTWTNYNNTSGGSSYIEVY